ncbi:MAG TPA: GDCCVxC domain-containing (seleno)protein [archaeon]|nr:GDCCVxC domain-containing (seleno)protein [archaeon]
MAGAGKSTGVLTCPKCGGRQEMEIPEGKCIPFYKCGSCGEVVEAKDKCCVFCDYGDRKCPVGHA